MRAKIVWKTLMSKTIEKILQKKPKNRNENTMSMFQLCFSLHFCANMLIFSFLFSCTRLAATSCSCSVILGVKINSLGWHFDFICKTREKAQTIVANSWSWARASTRYKWSVENAKYFQCCKWNRWLKSINVNMENGSDPVRKVKLK